MPGNYLDFSISDRNASSALRPYHLEDLLPFGGGTGCVQLAAAFGAILYTVVTGDSIVSALTNIISRALNTNV